MTGFYQHLEFATVYPPVKLKPPRGRPGRHLDIHWVIPTFQQGAGGTMTILRFVHGFEQLGHRCTVWLDRRGKPATVPAQHFRTLVLDHFIKVEAEFEHFPQDPGSVSGDVVIATDRFTCFPVRAMPNFRRRFYFIQDQEDLFFPVGAESLLSKKTYDFGFDGLCASQWLKDYVRREHSMWAMKWDLAVDQTAYSANGAPPKNEIPRIACYARYVTPRRCVELAMLALDLLAAKGVKFHVDFFGWDEPKLDVKYSYRWHGVLSPRQLGDLYRSCDVGMVFSATNYSLIPKEMMACGLPVLELDSSAIHSAFPEGTVVKTDPDPLEVARNLERLIRHPALRRKIGRQGHEFASAFSWPDSVRMVERAIRQRLQQSSVKRGGRVGKQ